MIVPRDRLIATAGVLFIPAALLVAAFQSTIPVVGWLTAVFSVVAVIDALLVFILRKRVVAVFPPRLNLARNREGIFAFSITAAGSLPLRATIGFSFPEGFAPTGHSCSTFLTPVNKSQAFSVPLTGSLRGLFNLGKYDLRVHSILGFWESSEKGTIETNVSVYPDLSSARKDLAALFVRHSGLFHPRRQVGQGREFEKLRPYLPGDTIGDIHWKATAHRGSPVTKQYQVERTQEIYVAIDTSRLSNRSVPGEESGTILDRFITAALLMGMVAQRQGDLFGVISFADQVERFLPAKGGKGQISRCRELLYSATAKPATPDFEELATFIGTRLRRRALVLVLTSLDEPALAENFVRSVEVVGRRHLILTVMVNIAGLRPLFSEPVNGVEEIYHALAGHVQWHNLREVQELLGRRGVEFSLVANERLYPDLVARYLEVKRRQIL